MSMRCLHRQSDEAAQEEQLAASCKPEASIQSAKGAIQLTHSLSITTRVWLLTVDTR